jgi:hypothetical protein
MRAATGVLALVLAAALHQLAPLLFRGVFRLASCPLVRNRSRVVLALRES